MTQKEINIEDKVLLDSRRDALNLFCQTPIYALVAKTPLTPKDYDGAEPELTEPDDKGFIAVKPSLNTEILIAAFASLSPNDWDRWYFTYEPIYLDDYWAAIEILIFNRASDEKAGEIHLTLEGPDSFWVTEQDGPWTEISPYFYNTFGIEVETEEGEERQVFTKHSIDHDNSIYRGLINRLNELSRLENNWDFEDSPKPSEGILRNAKKLIDRLPFRLLAQLSDVEDALMPMPGGKLELNWSTSDMMNRGTRTAASIEIAENGCGAFIRITEGETRYIGKFDPETYDMEDLSRDILLSTLSL